MSIVRGFVAPFRGAAFVARHGLWRYLALPLLLNGVLALLAGWVGLRLARWKLGDAFLAGSPVLSWLLLALAAGVAAIVVFILFQPVLAGPFIDLLSERVEVIARGSVPGQTLLRSAGQSILHGVLKLLLYLFALAVTLALGALTGLGSFLGAALYAVFLAYDGFDFPLARRGVSFGGKWRYLSLHPGQTLGYCVGASVLFFVPLLGIVAPAFAAVGATLAYLETEPARAAHSQSN